MLAFPIMLVDAAEQAGIAIPPENQINDASYDRNQYPHWHVLCITQLGRRMQHGEHFDNAVNLAKIDVETLRTMDVAALERAGVNCHGGL